MVWKLFLLRSPTCYATKIFVVSRKLEVSFKILLYFLNMQDFLKVTTVVPKVVPKTAVTINFRNKNTAISEVG